jgi:Uma2 family endonuclease
MSMVQQAERPYTAEDLARMPDDGKRYEIIGGELIASPAPSTKHQWVSDALTAQIRVHGLQGRLGAAYFAPVDVRLGLHNIVQPDIVFVQRGNIRIVDDSGINGAPDLVIEIVSPSSRGRDRIRKSALYADSGVPEFWLVDPDTETILAQELREGRYHPIPSEDGLIRSKVLDGLVIDPREIFAEPEWMQGIGE